MRTTACLIALASLILLLPTRAHGIRLDRHLHDAINNKDLRGDSKTGQPSNVAHSISKHCTSNGQCSGMAATKYQGVEAEVTKSHGDAAAKVPGVARQPPTGTRTYPDIVDIAGMDYSPAARKPPIHN